MEAINMKTIEFQITYAKNENVYENGYCEIPDDLDEEVEYFFYNQSGLTQPRRFIHHDEIGLNRIGATDEQMSEVDNFKLELAEFVDFIAEAIELAEEDDNRTYFKGDLIITINEGAKFTVLFEDYNNPEWDSQYYMAATVMFNNQRVVLDEDVFFEDPYTYEDYNVGSDVIYENGAYVVEIPKSYWEDDKSGITKEEIINNYTEAFRDAYAQTISKNLGVWSKYGENVEQLFEDCDINEIALVNDDNLEAFLKWEGILN